MKEHTVLAIDLSLRSTPPCHHHTSCIHPSTMLCKMIVDSDEKLNYASSSLEKKSGGRTGLVTDDPNTLRALLGYILLLAFAE